MSNPLIAKSSIIIAQKKTNIPNFRVGSTVSVFYKIREGEKSRTQIFTGVVINRHAKTSTDASFTVLKNSTAGIKAERVFPLHSPLIEKIEIVTLRRAKRANLRYLRHKRDPIKDLRAKTIVAK